MGEALRQIRKKLAEEQKEVMELIDQLARPHPSGEVRRLLSRLYSRLTEHFRREQNPGGLYEVLSAGEEGAGEMVNILVGEHFEILSQVRNAIDRTRQGIADAAISEHVAELVHMLRDHEEREEAFVARLLTE